MKKTLIPERLRITHTSSSFIPTPNEHGATDGMFYCWSSFNGEVYFVFEPNSSQSGTPSAKIYVNGNLYSTKSMRQIYVGDGSVYECIFSGLSYGDEYYITCIHGSIEISLNTRKYIGGGGNPPVLSETDSTINATMQSPYNKNYSMALGVLNFNSDYGSLNSYSRAARDLLYASALQSTEQDAILGKVGNEASFNLDMYNQETDEWGTPNTFTTEASIYKFIWSPVRVGIISSTSSNYYSMFSTYLNEWIADMNNLIGDECEFIRDDSISEDDDEAIHIILGTHSELWGYNPDTAASETFINYGTWSQTYLYTNNGCPAHCEVKLCNELRGAIFEPASFRDILYEELTECLGCGNDTYHTYESMFSQIWYKGKRNNLLNSDGTPTVDGEVVQMLYKEFDVGEKASTVVHKLTPSTGAVVQLPCAKFSGGKYTVTPYAMNREVTYSDGYWSWNSSNNGYSDFGDSITIEIYRPDIFEWDADTVDVYGDKNGEDFNLRATEWNRLMNNINDVRIYRGKSEITFETVEPNDDFMAYMYNDAVSAIQGIGSDGEYGSYLYEVEPGDDITPKKLNDLRSELNIIP